MIEHYYGNTPEVDAAAPGSAFYVTIVRSRTQIGLLAGPYTSYAEAESQVDPMRKRAYEVDPMSGFDAFGVSAITPGAGRPFPKARLVQVG